MAAAEANRDIEYCAYNVSSVCQPLEDIYLKLTERQTTVGELFRWLVRLDTSIPVFEQLSGILNLSELPPEKARVGDAAMCQNEAMLNQVEENDTDLNS